MAIKKTISIEDLVEEYPLSVKFLADKNIKCIACGEPIWGTLEEACKEKDLSDEEIEEITEELNELTDNKQQK